MRLKKPQVGLLILILIAFGMSCRLTSVMPASWSGTPTAESLAKTNAVIIQTQGANQEQFIRITQTETPIAVDEESTPTPEPISEAVGPWLVYQSPDGHALHAYDVEAKIILEISLPKPIYTSDLTQGLSPDGNTLIIRAGSPQNTNELALYKINLPSTDAVKITPLLSISLQQQIVNDDGNSGGEVFQAVTLPDGLTWSPDGRFLAFSAGLDFEASNLYVFDTQTNRVSRLNGFQTQNATPSWADGNTWLISQELGSFEPDHGWRSHFVSGLHIPNFNLQKTVYLPIPQSKREVFVGWINAESFISYSQTIEGPHTLRLVNIETLLVSDIFTGAFDQAAFDPTSRTLAFTLSYEKAAPLGMDGGVYVLRQGTPYYTIQRAGHWTQITWDKGGIFVAKSQQGVLTFSPEDEEGLFLQDEENARLSPHGNWIVAWGSGPNSEGGARLYLPTSSYSLQTLSEQNIETVFWGPDSNAFFILAEGDLFHLTFPDLKLTEVESGFMGEFQLDMVWVE